ncbi:MAG: cardiolipin synthase [Bacteroidaceae bacterium]|jgi:cardiolipin synthase|nr:cardiolipin synthase [Bacteroidaceae bacterium]
MEIQFWIKLVILLFALNLSVVVMMQRRRPSDAWAWILVLVFVPVMGILLYYLFGFPAKDRPLISDERLQILKSYTAPLCTEGEDGVNPLIPLLQRVNQSYPTRGNGIEFYTAFADMFQALKADIQAARHHIHLEFFQIESDPVGDELSDLLINKVKEGVEVRVIYDAAACWLVPRSFYRRMQNGGVQIKAFNPIFPILSPFSNYRDHRKVVVIDGKIGFTGGMNIAERYLLGVRGGIWRDTHIRMIGPSVSELQTAFLSDWQFTRKEWIHDDVYYPVPLRSDQNLLIQMISSNPTDSWRVMDLSISQTIFSSRRYLYLQSPYFLPSESIRVSLHAAALSGVDVRVMIPTQPDKGHITINASRWYVEQMLQAGVRFYFYDNGYMHSKTIVSDDQITSIGSVNIDSRSLSQAFEIDAFIYDREVALHQKQLFLDDIKFCHELDLKTWQQRPRWDRVKESFCHLLAPLL